MDRIAFEKHLTIKGKHENTIKKHLKNLDTLTRKIGKITTGNFEEFLYDLKKQGRRNATLNAYIDTVRIYARFAGLDVSLQEIKHLPKDQDVRKSTLSDDEIETFLNLPAPENSNVTQTKVYEDQTLFFAFLAYTGARPGEVSKLKPDDINLSGTPTAHIATGKNGKPRMIYLPPPLVKLITGHSMPSNGYIFQTIRGNKYSETSWSHAFKKRIKRMGIKRDGLTPYSFRHSAATRWLSQDINIHKIAKQLGHDIKQTQTYEHLVVKDLENSIKTDPLVKKHVPVEQLMGQILDEIKKLIDERVSLEIAQDDNSLKIEIKKR